MTSDSNGAIIRWRLAGTNKYKFGIVPFVRLYSSLMYRLKEHAVLLSVESFKCMRGLRPLARVASIEAKVLSGAFKYCLDIISVDGRELIASVRSSAGCLKNSRISWFVLRPCKSRYFQPSANIAPAANPHNGSFAPSCSNRIEAKVS